MRPFRSIERLNFGMNLKMLGLKVNVFSRFSPKQTPHAWHTTVYCFSPKMCCIYGNTQKFLVCSLNGVQLVLNRNGRKDDRQQTQGSYKKYISKDCITS